MENNVFKNKYFVPLFAVLACILWGGAFPSLKISYLRLSIANNDYFLKMLFASYRFFIASVMLFAWYLLSKKGKGSLKSVLRVERVDFLFLLILGLLQTTLQYFFFYNGLANTTGVKSSILTTLSIFITLIAVHFIYQDDRISGQKILGLIAGFTGVILVNLSKEGFDFAFKFTGEGFIILSAITSTIAAIMVRNKKGRIEPLLLTAYQMLLGSIALFLLAIIKVNPWTLDFDLLSGMLLIFLAMISAVGFGLWYSLISFNSLGYISLYKFIIPVSGVLLSVLFLAEEKLTLNIVWALVLVSVGIIMINYRKRGNIHAKAENKD